MRTNRKILISAGIAAMVFIGVISSCGIKQEKKKIDLPDLNIGIVTHSPYFYTDEDGNPGGIDVEIAKEACARIGYEPKFLEIDWLKKNEYLADRTIDCIWTCYTINGREDRYDWAGPYATDRQVVAVTDSSEIYKMSDLEGKKIAVQMTSMPEEIFLNRSIDGIPKVENVFCMYDMDESVSALRRKYVDACAGHEPALKEKLESLDVDYRILDEPILTADLGVAFKKNCGSEVYRDLNTVLIQMRREGFVERVYEKYGLKDWGCSGE